MVQNGKLNIAMKGKPALSTPHVQNPVNATHVIANTSTGNDSEVDARGFKTFKSRPLRFARREEPRGGVIIFRSAAAALGEENSSYHLLEASMLPLLNLACLRVRAQAAYREGWPTNTLPFPTQCHVKLF